MYEPIGEALAMHSPLPAPHGTCDCGRPLETPHEVQQRVCTYCEMYGDQPCAPAEDAMAYAEPIVGRTRQLLYGHNDDSIYGVNGDSGHDNNGSAAEDASSAPMYITVDDNSLHLR